MTKSIIFFAFSLLTTNTCFPVNLGQWYGFVYLYTNKRLWGQWESCYHQKFAYRRIKIIDYLFGWKRYSPQPHSLDNFPTIISITNQRLSHLLSFDSPQSSGIFPFCLHKQFHFYVHNSHSAIILFDPQLYSSFNYHSFPLDQIQRLIHLPSFWFTTILFHLQVSFLLSPPSHSFWFHLHITFLQLSRRNPLSHSVTILLNLFVLTFFVHTSTFYLFTVASICVIICCLFILPLTIFKVLTPSMYLCYYLLFVLTPVIRSCYQLLFMCNLKIYVHPLYSHLT